MEKSEYKSLNEWASKNPKIYDVARKRNLLNKICITFGWDKNWRLKKPNGYWTLEKCKKDALNYKSRNEWNVNSHSGYQKAYINNWLSECCQHMKK